MRRGRYVIAALALILATVSCFKDPQKILADADAHRKLGQHELAVKEYGKVIKRQPSNQSAHLGMGLSLLALGRKVEAKQSLENVLKLAEETDAASQSHRALGDMAMEAGDPAGAVAHYSKVEELDPKVLLDARIALVKFLLGKGDEGAAIKEILNLMSARKRPPELDALLADPATEKVRAKIRLHLVEVAEEKIKASKFDEAKILLEQSRNYPSPEAEEVRLTAAWAVVHSELGECDKATAKWVEAVKAQPDNARKAAYYNAVCELRSGHALDALNSLEKIPQADSFYSDAQLRIADALKVIPTQRFKVCLEKGNVRSGPSLKSPIIATWNLAKEVRVIEKLPKDWYRVNFEGKSSAYMHEDVISNLPVAVIIKKNGWQRVASSDWMLIFRPMVEFKLTNLGEKPIKSLRLNMVVRQGKKVVSDDKFKVEISDRTPLKPDNSIIAQTPSSVRVELLTEPARTSVTIAVSIEGGEFVVYRELELNRDVMEFVEDEG